MRRSLLSTGAIAALGFSLIGAPCGGPGPQSRTFAAGSLVIPMDSCYQTRGTPPAGGVACNATGDDGVFRAYGLVYFLLKNGITVYWMIDPAKTSVTGVDATVPAPATGSVAQKMRWADGAFADFGIPTGTGISYIGAPFAIDSADAAAVVDMLTNAANPKHADFARFQAEATRTTPAPITIEIHKVQSGFTANQVRPLVGPPRPAPAAPGVPARARCCRRRRCATWRTTTATDWWTPPPPAPARSTRSDNAPGASASAPI